MVTGRISLRSPEYSPISSSVSEVRATSSRFHCRAATMLVTRISVVALGFRHRGRADQRLTGAARKYHHPGAAGPERVRCQLLVIAQVPVVLLQADRVRLAVYVAREILRGPTDLEQQLLDPAPFAGVHDHGVIIDAGAQHRCDLLVAQHLLEHRTIEAHQRQAVHRAFDQLQPAVAGHGVDDVDQQRLRHRVAREGHQRVDDLFGVVAGGAGVPQRQRCDAVGVHVLGRAFQLGERCDGGACRAGQLVVHFEQHRLVGLHDQRSVSHWRRSSSSLRSASSPARVIALIIRTRPTPPT